LPAALFEDFLLERSDDTTIEDGSSSNGDAANTVTTCFSFLCQVRAEKALQKW
jgi:hypothetical protein